MVRAHLRGSTAEEADERDLISALALTLGPVSLLFHC